MELCLEVDEEPKEILWVRIKERTGKSDFIAMAALSHLTRKTK